MKKLSVFIAVLWLAQTAFCGVPEEELFVAFPYRVVSDTVNPSRPVTEGKVKFVIDSPEFVNTPFQVVLRTSVNGVWKDMPVDENQSFEYLLEPGVYSFQFYVNGNFQEIFIRDFEVKPQHDIDTKIYFYQNELYNGELIPVTVDKPVIYLHSETPVDFDLSVQPKGKFTFTYPELNGSWKGTTQTDGSVAVNGKNYPYLFWESNQNYRFQSTGNGFRVAKNELTAFLEKQLTAFGFNDREKTDFITYWAPKMSVHEEVFVQFSVDEACNAFAEMTYSPQPDHVRRVYVQWTDWAPEYEQFLQELEVAPLNREGFTLIEWGGFEFINYLNAN